MGIIHAFLGNASQIDPEKMAKEFGPILTQGEQIELAFKLIRDTFVFTNKRLIIADKQGLTGKKVEYHSIPYKSITHFSVETSGRFDDDAEMKIWLSGSAAPIEKEFKKDSNVMAVQQALAFYVTK